MLELKIGLQLRSLRQPFRQALLTAARLGARAVEIDARSDLPTAEASQTALRQVRKELDDRGLRVCAVSFPTRRGYGVAEQLDRRVEGTKRAMELAHALGAPCVVNHIGRIPSDEESPEWQLLVEVLNDLGRHAQRVGAILAAETSTDSGATFARLIKALPLGSLGIHYDPGGLVLGGFDPMEVVAAVGAHVMHVHVRDAVPDARPGEGAEVALGRGVVDFPAVLAALEEQGYRGYFTLRRQSAENPVNELSLAIEYLRNLWN